MVRAWDDKDYKLCSFKHILFNDLSQAGQDGMMQTPPADQLQRARAESLAAADTGLWERADAQNPNPARFLPVQITGFTALHNRRQQQIQAARDVSAKLAEAQKELRTLADEREVAINMRLRHYTERQRLLSHRVLRLYAALERQHLLRCHNGVEPPLAQPELVWTRKLKELASEMGQPDAARLYDLAANLQREATTNGGGHDGSGLPDPSLLRLDNLEEYLSKQQEAVKKLIETSNDDLKDVGIVLGLGEN